MSAQLNWGYQIHQSVSQRLVVVRLDTIPLLEVVNVKFLRFFISHLLKQKLARKRARLVQILEHVKHATLTITSLVQVVSPVQREHILILLHLVQVYHKILKAFSQIILH